MSSLILTPIAELLLFKFEVNVENSPRAITHFERSFTLVFSSLSLSKRGQAGGFKCHKWHPKKTKNLSYFHIHPIHLSNVKYVNMKRLNNYIVNTKVPKLR